MGTKWFNVQMRVSVQFQRALNNTISEERKTWTSWMTWSEVNYQQNSFKGKMNVMFLDTS